MGDETGANWGYHVWVVLWDNADQDANSPAVELAQVNNQTKAQLSTVANNVQ